MAKKPDISDLTKKIDIGGFVNSIKSMISSTGDVPEVDPADRIGVKIAELCTLSKSLAEIHAQQAKDYARINQLLNGLYEDLKEFRKPPAPEETTTTASKEPEHEPSEEKPKSPSNQPTDKEE